MAQIPRQRSRMQSMRFCACEVCQPAATIHHMMKPDLLLARRIVFGISLGTTLIRSILAQDAAPADRNTVNTTNRPGGMMADSPVKFPKEGALPAKFSPDVRAKTYDPGEKDYYLFSTPERSLAQIASIQAEMPAGRFTPPPMDWTPLQRTHRILTEGGELRLLAWATAS